MTVMLSKSKFLAGCQCLKRLYLQVQQPELGAERTMLQTQSWRRGARSAALLNLFQNKLSLCDLVRDAGFPRWAWPVSNLCEFSGGKDCSCKKNGVLPFLSHWKWLREFADWRGNGDAQLNAPERKTASAYVSTTLGMQT